LEKQDLVFPITKFWYTGRICHYILNCPNGRVREGKEACVLQRRYGCRDGLQNYCLRIGSPGRMRTCDLPYSITAWWYGELPHQLASQPADRAALLTRKPTGLSSMNSHATENQISRIKYARIDFVS
jgi:hypothetical protein